jgi:hypothetical protein
MSGPNLFFVEDFSLATTKLTKLHDLPQWVWSCRLYEKHFTCSRRYTTEHGAYKAGEHWLKKNFHTSYGLYNEES